MKTLPNYNDLEYNYPILGTVDEIKEKIGGNVNQEHYKNSCIMRVSKALNYAGALIPHDSPRFRTQRGADGKYYGLRVNEFWNYMLRTYGKPTVHSPIGQKINRDEFAGIRGIIGFHVKFNDATGHFTLWNGFKLKHGGDLHDYFGIAFEAALWEA